MDFRYSFGLAAAMTLLLSSVNGHMKLKTPAPFDPDALNNSPLDGAGADFPCKAPTIKYINAANTAKIGEPQTLSFTGSAVHGGGSCQVSLTTDPAPSKSTKWMVIHSIEGGCPAKNVDGNLADNPNGDGSNNYTFTVPDGITPGQYVLAWTWFNKIGNREMYMNCAPLTVTPGSKKRGIEQRKADSRSLLKRADFPDMFVANIGNGCSTADGDLEFPNPGPSLENFNKTALLPPVGNCAGSSGRSSGGSSNGSAGNASAPTASAPAASAPATSAAAGATATGGIFNGIPATSSVVATPIPSSAPVAAPSAAPSAANPAPAGGSNSSGTSGAGAMTGACTQEGMWNCIGGSSFQRCASGAWSPVTPMAGGTSCTTGQSMDFAIDKRGISRSGAHLRRHQAHFSGNF